MTYNEIMEFLYGGEGANSLDQLAPEDRAPWKVIQFFKERKGFDWWWSAIEDEIQDEMFNELRELLNDRQPET